MFFLLCRHNDDCVFDDFPKISDYFPKILQNLSKGHLNIAENFPEISKITEDFKGRPEDVPMIHQRFAKLISVKSSISSLLRIHQTSPGCGSI